MLDPFTLPQDTFFLDLLTGAVFVNPQLHKTQEKLAALAEKTIKRLDLDSQNNRDMRFEYISEYIKHKNKDLLKKWNPFVYYEMERQNKL